MSDSIPGKVAIVGVAESDRIGNVPDRSALQLHAEGGLNALDEAGLKLSDVDAIFNAGVPTTEVAEYLGVVPRYTDGTSVGGPLELPPGWKPGDKPLPLVVAIHGGPTTSSPNDLRYDPHNGRLYFAAAGYAVLCPNYRGSTGYGDQFTTDLIGNDGPSGERTVDVQINRLRRKIEADPANPIYLQTVRGLGYRLTITA